MLLAVEYVVTGNSAEHFEIYAPSVQPRTIRDVRRTVAHIRWGHQWWRYVWSVKIMSVEVLALPLPQATW